MRIDGNAKTGFHLGSNCNIGRSGSAGTSEEGGGKLEEEEHSKKLSCKGGHLEIFGFDLLVLVNVKILEEQM